MCKLERLRREAIFSHATEVSEFAKAPHNGSGPRCKGIILVVPVTGTGSIGEHPIQVILVDMRRRVAIPGQIAMVACLCDKSSDRILSLADRI